MAIEGSASVEIEAPIEEVFAVAADVEGSPRWQPEIKVAECLERDGDGNQVLVHTETDAKVRTLGSTLRFGYDEPTGISWEQEDGDLKSVEGSWELEDLGGGRTRATYWMEVDLGRMLGMVIRGPLVGVLRGQLVESMPGKLKGFVEGPVSERPAFAARAERRSPLMEQLATKKSHPRPRPTLDALLRALRARASSTCPAGAPGSGSRSATGRMGRRARRRRGHAEPARGNPDASISADRATWEPIASDVRGGMGASARAAPVRRNLHLGIGFLAADQRHDEPGRLRFESIETREGAISTLEAGEGQPMVCVHGLGGTKASFLPTVRRWPTRYRVIAVDLPGFGDSRQAARGRLRRAVLRRAVTALLDELELERRDLVGNSMGGRVAIEVGLLAPRAGRTASSC